MIKWYLLGLLLSVQTLAQDTQDYRRQPSTPIDSPQPYFKILNKKATNLDQIPLLLTTVDVNISGLMAEVEVTQFYKNSGSVPLEAQYVFPGSSDAAVYHLDMQVGQRVIKAEVKAKEKAQQVYDEAKKAGKTASLLEQGDPGLFTMNVANILPGDDIRVTLKYTEKIIPMQGKYQFKYPAVGRPSVLAGGSTGPQSYAPGNDMGFDLSVSIQSPIAINSIVSKNHGLTEEWSSDNQVLLLLDVNQTLNFEDDFIIEYDLRGAAINTGMVLYEDDQAGYFMLMMQPPAAFQPDEIIPREYVFVVDSSGSMSGAPIENAKFIASALLTELSPEEYFNVVLFAGGSKLLSTQPLSATEANINESLKMVDVSSAGGSTNLKQALEKINKIPPIEGVSRSLIILTDGAIWIADETIQLIRETSDQNVFVIGVSAGYGNDNAAIDSIAEAGQGLSFYANDDNDIAELQSQFLDYVRYPLLTDIKVETIGFEAVDIFPRHAVDLFAQKPLYLIGQYTGKKRGSLTITGQGNGRSYQQYFDLDGLENNDQNQSIKYQWAKEKIDDLMFNKQANEAAITALGLSHNLLTQYTSFVAVDHVVRNDGSLEKVTKSPYSETLSGYGFANQEVKIERAFYSSQKTGWLDKAVSPLLQTADYDPGARRSITFIIGEDRSLTNQFYQTAEVVYGSQGIYQTDLVVSHLRDVPAIKNYLLQHQDPKAPWGLINIVSHSSPWSGLSNSNAEGDLQSLNLFSLHDLISAETFQPLSDQVVDAFTEIRVLGCALGRQHHMLKALSVYFGGQDSMRPWVKAPVKHVYMEQNNDLNTADVYSYDMPWFIHKNPQFNRTLSAQYDIEEGDWNAQPIEIAFQIPGSADIPEKFMPKLLAEQTLLHMFLADMGVQVEDFTWQLKADKGHAARLVGTSYLITTDLDRVDTDRIVPLNFADNKMVSVNR